AAAQDDNIGASVVSHIRVDNRRNPLTPTTSRTWGPLLASADENASSSHPLPQRGEGSKINSPLAPLGGEGAGGEGVVPISSSNIAWDTTLARCLSGE